MSEQPIPLGWKKVNTRPYQPGDYFINSAGQPELAHFPSRVSYTIIEKLPAKRQLLILAYEIQDEPSSSLKVITPDLARGLVEAGYMAKIVDAPYD